MKKRITAWMLIYSLLMSLGIYFPRFSFALNTSIYTTYRATIESKYSEAERQTFKKRIDDLSEYKGRNEKLEETLYYSEITLNQILYYLIEYKGQSPKPSGYATRRINPYVYKKYKIIAYDELSVIEDEKAGHGSFERVDTVNGQEVEYRYLGFTESGTPITNDFYPADFSSGTDPLTRTYVTTQEAKGSWEVFNDMESHYGQLYQLMNTNLKNDDVTAGVYRNVGYTAFDLLKLTGFPGLSTYRSDGTVRAAQGKMVMMQFPSLNSVGQFKLIHGTYKKYYDTFRTQEMTLEADVTIYPETSVYFIAPNQEELTIEYEVRSIIDDSKTSLPYSNGLNISSVSIRSEGSEAKVFDNPLKTDKSLDRVLTSKFTKTVKVSDLNLKDGKDAVRLEASSYYTDMTDYVVAFNSLPVVVSVNASSDFMADFTVHDTAGNNVTDGVVTVKDMLFKTPSNLTLKDASITSKGNIISRKWSVLQNGSYKAINTGNETEVVFTVTEANRASVLNANKISFKLEVMTDLNADKEIAIHEVTFKKALPPQPVPAGPVAVIDAKLKRNSDEVFIVMEGKSFEINGRKSYHPEGLKLKRFDFITNGGYTSSAGGRKHDYIYYLNADTYFPELTVTDEKGGQDTDGVAIKVIPAEFNPVIKIEGSLKENRKVSFSVENEHKLRYFPIDESSLKWSITPLNGQGDEVCIDGSANGRKAFDALFKKKGSYRVTVSGYISSGLKRYKGSASEVFTISEDLPPVANFKVSSRFVRNVNNDNMTEIKIYDQSYSPDGDTISQRKYWYRYDEDNDGDFNDTDWILLSAANFDQMSVFSDSVGKYQFKVEVKEQFGQPTITRFVVDQDYRRGNTDSKADDEKKAEIINIAPTVSLDIDNKKPLTLVIYHDYDEVKLADLKNKLEILKAQLLGKRIDLKVEYLMPTETVGEKENIKTYYDTYISVGIYARYEYENSRGNDYQYNRVIPIKIYLDSFSNYGEIPTQSNEGRFKIISVEYQKDAGGSYYAEDRDREEKSWSNCDNIRVTYKDRGTLKTVNYKFAKGFREDRHYAAQGSSYDVYEARLGGYSLVVDRATQGDRYFNKVNYTPVIGDSWLMGYSLEAGGEVKVEPIKIYNEGDLNKIIEDIGEDDAFFINVVEKEENRLALDKDLKQVLSDKNIHYKSLIKDALYTNPLSGRYDEVALSDKGALYFKVADTTYTIMSAYESNYPYGYKYFRRFLPIGNGSKFEEVKNDSFVDKYKENVYSQYSYGYPYKEHYADTIMKYGLEALNYYRESYGEGRYYSWWDQWDEYDKPYWGDFLSNYIPDQQFRNLVGYPTVEKDGNLVGYKYKGDWYNRGIELYAAVWGTGYLGTLKDISFNNPTDEYEYGKKIRGFIHSDGNIYFKYPANFGVGYSLLDWFVITEGINNIDVIYKNEMQNSIYVITKDKKCVKYNIADRTKETVVEDFIERNGYSLKIGFNKWMVDGVIYDNVKQIHTDENRKIYERYSQGSRYYYGKMTLRYEIDENDNFTVTKKFNDVEKTYLIGTDVKELPFRGLDEEYNMTCVYGGSVSGFSNYNAIYEMYIGNDGYLYSAEIAMRKVDKFSTPTVTNPQQYGDSKIVNVDYLGDWYYKKANSDESQKVEGLVVYDEAGNLKIGGLSLDYATLTTGNKGDLVGDNNLISATANSATYYTIDNLIDSIYNYYGNYKSSNSIYILLNEAIESTTNYDDFEGDEAYKSFFDFEHVDPDYFENSLGKDPAAGTGLLAPLKTLKYVGLYIVKPKFKDNPKDDNRFDEYRLENKDESEVKVYVHRRPVAQMDFNFGESLIDPDYFSVTCKDTGSYDLDHLSEPERGIVERRFAIKSENEMNWTRVSSGEFTHQKIVPGIEYTIAYEVVDKEGAVSQPVIKKFKLKELPINLTAKLKANDNSFSVTAMPITEFFNVYDIETDYARELKLEIALYEGDARKGNLVTVPFIEGTTAATDTSNHNLVKWTQKDLQVPSILPDKSYKLIVKAIDVSNPSKTAEVTFDVSVRTPINPVPNIPQVFTANETVELTCRTSKYTDSLEVTIFDGTSKETTKAMTLVRQEGKYKVWRADYLVPEGLDDGTYKAVFTGTVNTLPAKKESATARFEYITLKILSAVMFPEDPMAGDELLWVIESMGGVDRYEIMFDQDIIDNDDREEMGYNKVEYPYYVEVDETQNRKTDELKYILWCTTPQTKTLKGKYNRQPYTFTIRAWKGSSHVNVEFKKEIIGDVRQLLKVGY